MGCCRFQTIPALREGIMGLAEQLCSTWRRKYHFVSCPTPCLPKPSTPHGSHFCPNRLKPKFSMVPLSYIP